MRRDEVWRWPKLPSVCLIGPFQAFSLTYCIKIPAWVLHKDVVCAPLVGVSKLERFDEVVGALDVKLSDEEMKFLEEPYQT